MTLNYSVLIPARLASTRLPRKPLADLGGKPMIVRVAEAALQSQARQVVVAADDAEIVAACRAFGVRALLTRSDHPSGSDRLAEACTLLGLHKGDVVVNVQGDEPLIRPELIDHCAQLLQQHPECVMSTVAHPIQQIEDLINPHVVKVVTDKQGLALYFSRAPIPWWRDGMPLQQLPTPAPLRHVGIYGYDAGFLLDFPHLQPAPLEHTESLEQLRALWHGHRIAVHVTPHQPGQGVDTPEDLQRVQKLFSAG